MIIPLYSDPLLSNKEILDKCPANIRQAIMYHDCKIIEEEDCIFYHKRDDDGKLLWIVKLKKEKMILYIDMDGVVADFDAGIRKYNPDLILSQGDFRDEVDTICEANPRIFLDLPPMPDSVDAVNRLFNSQRYDIMFLSTPMWNVPESFMDKRLWLEKHFGDWVEDKLILSKRKDLNLGSILIDDRLKNGVDKFRGNHIHFGTTKYPDWKSVLKLLL